MQETSTSSFKDYRSLQLFVEELHDELRTLPPDHVDIENYSEILAEALAKRQVMAADEQVVDEMFKTAETSIDTLNDIARTDECDPGLDSDAVHYLGLLRVAALFCIGNVVDVRTDNVLRAAARFGAIRAYTLVEDDKGNAPQIVHFAGPFERESAIVRGEVEGGEIETPLVRLASEPALVLSLAERDIPDKKKLPPKIEILLAKAAAEAAEIIDYAKVRGAMPDRITFKPNAAQTMFGIHPTDIVSARGNIVAQRLGLTYIEAVLIRLFFRSNRYTSLRGKHYFKLVEAMVQEEVRKAYAPPEE